MSHDTVAEQAAIARKRDAAQEAAGLKRAQGGNARPVPFRGGGFRHRPHGRVSLLVFVAVIVLWEIGCRTGFISTIALASPSQAFGAIMDLVYTGMLWKHVGLSLYRLIAGWTLGTLLGIAVGITIGLFSLVRAGLMPLVSALFPVPKIALLPLFVVWFGIGEGSKVATILFGTFFPTVIATYGGIDNVDRNLIRMGQSFGLNWLSIVRKIIMPGAMPAILSGFRISASIAIVLLVAAEMIGARYGIGAYILMAGALFAIDKLIAGVALLSLIGLVIAWLIGRAERHFLDWRT